MAPLFHKLSNLEVESLKIVECVSEPEQERSLDTLTTTPDDLDPAALLIGTLPINGGPGSGDGDGDCCCCCCCPCCCC
jgi:hypothetical protein